MGVAIAVSRLDYSVPELRSLARSEAGPVACRILAIAHVLEVLRAPRRLLYAEWIVRRCGIGRSWPKGSSGGAVGRPAKGHRFNADGIEGLANKALPGRSPALSDGQMAELREIVLAGPDLAKDGVVRWRCCDLQGVIAERFDVEVHERTVGKLLRRLRLTRLQPRPHNPKLDTQAQEVFKKASPRS